MTSHIENINQIINENSTKEPREIAKLINKYCSENPSINEIESRKLNQNIKLDGYNFAKTKNIVKIKARSSPTGRLTAKNKTQLKLREAEETKEKLKETESVLAELMKLVIEIRNQGLRPIEA